ncbi:MAG TPA: hypothetical protein VFO16_08900, partial [Pseudonocardiaceae bacterium]|nr:hypothetical protein [Pseudonocardiaceae bacterium]
PRSRGLGPDTASMTTLLLSVCLGADSTCVAMARHPGEFAHIKSLILLQPVSASYLIEEFVKASNIPDGYARFDKALRGRTGFRLAEQSPLEYAKSIRIPTLAAQVHHDSRTRPEAVQSIYDAIPVDEKKLVWIKGTTQRFRVPWFR